MGGFVDFQEIKQNVRIEDAAERLGLQIKKSGSQLRAPCPSCQSGGDRALVITPSKSAAYCFAEKRGGDVIWLVAHIQGVGMKEAAEFLAGNSTSEPVRSQRAVPEERKERGPKSGEGFSPLPYLDPAHEALSGLQIAEETLRYFGAGYAPKGVLRGFLALPLYTFDNVLRGYVGRNLSDEGPMLKFPNGVEPELYLFGTVQVREELYLFRDPLDVLRAHENGIEGGVCFLTETVSADQLQLLASLMDERGIEQIELL